MFPTRLPLRAALLSLVLTGPACAGDCWVDTVDDGSEIDMPMNAGLRAKLLQAERTLRTDAGINAMIRSVARIPASDRSVTMTKLDTDCSTCCQHGETLRGRSTRT